MWSIQSHLHMWLYAQMRVFLSMNILYNTSFNVHFVVVVVIQSSDVDSKTPTLLLINSTAEIFYHCTSLQQVEYYIL